MTTPIGPIIAGITTVDAERTDLQVKLDAAYADNAHLRLLLSMVVPAPVPPPVTPPPVTPPSTIPTGQIVSYVPPGPLPTPQSGYAYVLKAGGVYTLPRSMTFAGQDISIMCPDGQAIVNVPPNIGIAFYVAGQRLLFQGLDLRGINERGQYFAGDNLANDGITIDRVRAIATGSPTGECSMIYAKGKNWTITNSRWVNQTTGWMLRSYVSTGLKFVGNKALEQVINTSVLRLHGPQDGSLVQNNILMGLANSGNIADALADIEAFLANAPKIGTALDWKGLVGLGLADGGGATYPAGSALTNIKLWDNTIVGGQLRIMEGIKGLEIARNRVEANGYALAFDQGPTTGVVVKDNLLVDPPPYSADFKGIFINTAKGATTPTSSNNAYLGSGDPGPGVTRIVSAAGTPWEKAGAKP